MNAGPTQDPDPQWRQWLERAPELYDQIYYSGARYSLVSRINTEGHRQVERELGADKRFGSVIEVGAGTGRHLSHVRHNFSTYVMTDVSVGLLSQAALRWRGHPGVAFELADGAHLPHADDTFDRLVAVYCLEHMPDAHLVLLEWQRVVRHGGVVSIAIPTEGGIAWNLGRRLVTRRAFARQGLDLDYIIAREHVNACYRLVALVRHAFPRRRELWFPFRIGGPHFNLVYTCTAWVRK